MRRSFRWTTDAVAVLSAPVDPDEFLSIAGHELKTPLTPLKAIAQLLRSRIRRARGDPASLDLEAMERNLASLERQVDRMDRMVTDLLEVSRIARGTFKLEPIPLDLAEVVRQVVQRASEAAAEGERHEFDLDAPPSLPVTGDKARIEQLLAGLVGNAVKFSPRGGRVIVRVASEGDRAVVQIRDEGIGMTSDEMARAGRERFWRSDRAHGFGGVGAGLFLGRMIVEGHLGTLELESEGEGKGTTARLGLPL